MGMRPRAIEVRIEELVLQGFSSADRLRIGAAVERELGRLLREGGLPESLAGGLERETIDAGSFARSSQATASTLGESVARSVYTGLGR
jgi:hypothetical protein